MWYYAIDGERRGPVSEAALLALYANRRISRGTLVWCSGMSEWKRIERVPVFGKIAKTRMDAMSRGIRVGTMFLRAFLIGLACLFLYRIVYKLENLDVYYGIVGGKFSSMDAALAMLEQSMYSRFLTVVMLGFAGVCFFMFYKWADAACSAASKMDVSFRVTAPMFAGAFLIPFANVILVPLYFYRLVRSYTRVGMVTHVYDKFLVVNWSLYWFFFYMGMMTRLLGISRSGTMEKTVATNLSLIFTDAIGFVFLVLFIMLITRISSRQISFYKKKAMGF